MPSLTLLGLPLEMRLRIFAYLFQDSEVEVGKDLSTEELNTCVYVDNAILYTCKQLHIEARPVLWSAIELTLTFVEPEDLARAIDRSHWGFIQHLSLEFDYDQRFNLKPFTALRRLTITHEEAPYRSFTAFLFPRTSRQKAKALLCKTWLKKILTSPHRSFEVTTTATGFYDRNTSWVTLSYSLDSMETLKRDAQYVCNDILLTKIWDNGSIETWGCQMERPDTEKKLFSKAQWVKADKIEYSDPEIIDAELTEPGEDEL